jgi:6-phosphogluconolactonase (cycloisomerase 2 family)
LTAFGADASTRFVYVANRDSNNVSVFALDLALGTLTPASASPFAAGMGPLAVATAGTQPFVYVMNGTSDNVSEFKINNDGTLTSIGTALTGSHPVQGLAVQDATSGNRWFLVSNGSSDSMSVFGINPTTGLLSPASGSPFGVATSPLGIDFIDRARSFRSAPSACNSTRARTRGR